MGGDAVSLDLRRALEGKYPLIPREEDERIVQSFADLMAVGTDQTQPLTTFFDRVMKFVFRQFGFTEVAIGLKERDDDVWRYVALFGFKKEVENELLKTRYDRDDMYSQERYPNVKTGRLSELNMAEGLPEAETSLYDRPFHWRGKRATNDDFVPGDFFDFWMLDEKKEIIGWLEVSGPMDGRLPSRTIVRWLELLASMCSEALRYRLAEQSS